MQTESNTYANTQIPTGRRGELHSLFYRTVRSVNIRHYSLEQVQAWAPDDMDMAEWTKRMAENNPSVCVIDQEIAGYADLQLSGYIDQFYVSVSRQRRGIGRYLMEAIISEAISLKISRLHSNVSITAKPFFESHGFQAVKKQLVNLNRITFTNYRMSRAGLESRSSEISKRSLSSE